MLDERRHFKRNPYDGTISYSVNVLEYGNFKKLDLIGIILNISQDGLCMITDYPVERGHVLRFNSCIEQKAGIVRWRKDSVYNFYSVGVKFLPVIQDYQEPEV